MKKTLAIGVCILVIPLTNMIADAFENKQVEVHVGADQVTVIDALPAENSGVNISKTPTFNSITRKVKNNTVSINVSEEPVFVVEGELPKSANLKPQNSPFGFLPANVNNTDYSYALDIGVVWERGGVFPFFWSVVQSDPKVVAYNWEPYDRYFENLPMSIQEVKNISVTRFPMGALNPPPQNRAIPREDRSPQGRRPSREQRTPELAVTGGQQSGFSQAHVDGDSYKPIDVNMYLRWVKATVERYNGDGKNDMPGLKNPVRFWQIDNEPGNNRQDYSDLVRMTSQAIKEADPSAKVILGGLFLPVAGATRRYESNQLSLLDGLANSVDIVDIHWFGQCGEWKEFVAGLSRVKQDLRKFGLSNKSIYMTEVGTYSGNPSSRGGSSAKLQTERDQAAEMLKRYVVTLSAGVERVFWAFGIMEGYRNPSDNDFFDNTGVLYDGIGPNDPGKGVKKISYWTYKKMTDMLKFWDGSLPERIDVSTEIHAYRFKFHNNENRGIVVIWAD